MDGRDARDALTSRHAGEVLVRELDRAIRIDVAGEDEDGVRAVVVPGVVLLQHRLGEGAHARLVAGDGEAERVVRIDELTRQVVGVDHPSLVVEVLEDLLADDLLLDLDVRERRIDHDLGEEAGRVRERLAGERHREDAEVHLRRRVEVAAEALEREVHVVRVGEARSPPIEHVLEEVREAVLCGRLEARADAHVEGHVRLMELGLGRDDDLEPVVERRDPMGGAPGDRLSGDVHHPTSPLDRRARVRTAYSSSSSRWVPASVLWPKRLFSSTLISCFEDSRRRRT